MPGIHPSLGWFPKRGEVCLVQLDKPPPAIILSVDQLNRHALDVGVVGITTKQHFKFSLRLPLKAKEGGLGFRLLGEMRSGHHVEKSLLRYPALGALSATSMARIEEQVRIALGLL